MLKSTFFHPERTAAAGRETMARGKRQGAKELREPYNIVYSFRFRVTFVPKTFRGKHDFYVCVQCYIYDDTKCIFPRRGFGREKASADLGLTWNRFSSAIASSMCTYGLRFEDFRNSRSCAIPPLT